MVVTTMAVISATAVITTIIPAYITRVVTIGRAVIAIVVGRRCIGRVVGRVASIIVRPAVIPAANANPYTHTNMDPRLGLGGKAQHQQYRQHEEEFFHNNSPIFKTLEAFD
jgi:hypothetical protein